MFPREAGKAARHTFHPAALVKSRTFESDEKALPPLPLTFRSRPVTLPNNKRDTAGSVAPSTVTHLAACVETPDGTAQCPRGGQGDSGKSDSNQNQLVGGICSGGGPNGTDSEGGAIEDEQDILWIGLTLPARPPWTKDAAKAASAMARKYHFEHICVILVDGATETAPGLCVLRFAGGHGLDKEYFPRELSDRSLDLITQSTSWVHVGGGVSRGSKLQCIGGMIDKAVVIFTFFNLRLIYHDYEGLRRDAEHLLHLLPPDDFE
jgi:hypothetical protein